MKKLWNLISIIAFVNLLAVLGFGGWLWSSGRMDKEKLREMLAPPPPPVEPAGPEPEPEPEANLTPTGVRIDANDRQMRREALSLRRLQEEKQQLDKVLDQRETKLTSEQEAFAAERAAWEASMDEVKSAKTDEQFNKAVKLLESVPAKQGKELILELVNSEKKDEAVAYLDAMSAFKRSSLLKAFKGEEEMKVATELLEAIRKRTPDTRPDKQVAEKSGAQTPTPPAKPASGTASKPSAPGSTNATAPARPNGPTQPDAPKPATAGEGKGQPGVGSDKPASTPEKPIANTGAEIDKPGEGSDRKPSDGASPPAGNGKPRA